MSFRNFIRTGSYVNLDYVYSDLSNSYGENPLNYEGIKRSEKILKIVALNALTGESIYFDKDDMAQDDYDILKASSNIPVICKPYFVKGIPCYDGGLAEPVPIKKAFEEGCEKVVVVLTKPREFLRIPDKDVRISRLIRYKYDKVAHSLKTRAEKYNESVALAKEYEKQGKVLIVAPTDISGMRTLTKNSEGMQRMYDQGYTAAKSITAFLNAR
jgi:predicted patatin/cPLA2 family phospholipase